MWTRIVKKTGEDEKSKVKKTLERELFSELVLKDRVSWDFTLI